MCEEKEGKRWYSFETWFKSVRDLVRQYLKAEDIEYELSKCYQGYHFEIRCTKQEAHNFNAFMDSISITSKGDE